MEKKIGSGKNGGYNFMKEVSRHSLGTFILNGDGYNVEFLLVHNVED